MVVGQNRPRLLEREAELSFLADRLTAVLTSGRGETLAIEGAAGVGKTALLAEMSRRGSPDGPVVLPAAGGELEQDLSWGVVRELFGRHLRQLDAPERDRVLAGAAQHAASVFALEPSALLPPADTDPLAAVLNGLYWTVAGLADAAPLLICIDDAHWADIPSLRFLAYLSSRVDELPVLLVLAFRPMAQPVGAEDSHSVSALLGAIASVSEVRRLTPLSPEAAGELVRVALGPNADAEFCGACHGSTQGNPFLLRELTASLAADGIEPVAANAALVSGIRPEHVVRSVLRRLAQLSQAAVQLARAVSVLGTHGPLVVARDLAGLDQHELEEAFEALVGSDILTDDPEPAFVHPLVRDVIYSEMSALVRARLHAAAARQLIERGAALAEIANQLMSTDAHELDDAASLLLSAAEEAVARGAADTAADYARRALAEASSDSIAVGLLRALGRAQLALGEVDGIRTLASAFDTSQQRDVRQQIALEISLAARPVRENPTAIRVLEQALAEADGEGRPVERLRGELISHQMMEPSTIDHAVKQIITFTSEHETLRDPVLLATIALSLAIGAKQREVAIDCAKRAMAGMDPEEPNPSAASPATQALGACDQLLAARDAMTLVVERAARIGSAPLFGFASCYRSRFIRHIGDLPEAESDARAAIEIFEEHGTRRSEARAFLLDILVDRGDLAAGQAQADALEQAEEHMQVWDRAWSGVAIARLWIANGRYQDALELLRKAGENVERATGMRNALSSPWRIEAAELLAQLGQTREGLELLEPALKRAVSFGAPRGKGIALRAKGLLIGGAEGISLLEQATDALEASESLLERARTLVELGAALRRSGHRSDAQTRLREALDLATRCRMTPLADRARAELVTAGARPRRDALRGRDALTASELRVSEMAASAMTNRQIAQALFVSERTVETHLTHAYQKLDIASRGELREALAART